MSETTPRNPMDACAIYTRVIAGDYDKSWADRWTEATADASLQELAIAVREASMMEHSARWAFADRLISYGHAVGFHGRDPSTYLGCSWFVAPFLGELHVHYGAGDDRKDWYCDALDVATCGDRCITDAGGFIVARTKGDGYVVLTSANRIAPLPWAESEET